MNRVFIAQNIRRTGINDVINKDVNNSYEDKEPSSMMRKLSQTMCMLCDEFNEIIRPS